MTFDRTPTRDVRQRLARLAASAEPAANADIGQDWLLKPVPGDRVDGSAVDAPADAGPAPPDPPWWRRGRSGRLIERWTPPAPAGQHSLAPDRDPPRRRPRVVLVSAGVLVVVTGVALAVSAPAARPQVAPNLPAAVVDTASAPPSVSTESIVVNVVGKVAQPGLVTLTAGARVADAVQAAGSVLPGTDTTGLNLARRLADGEQVFVGVAAPPGAAPLAEGDTGGPVDLNTATLSELDTLPGVGEVTAKRILDWRTKHGRFTSVDQLREIDGIGPARFTSLRDLVVVR